MKKSLTQQTEGRTGFAGQGGTLQLPTKPSVVFFELEREHRAAKCRDHGQGQS